MTEGDYQQWLVKQRQTDANIAALRRDLRAPTDPSRLRHWWHRSVLHHPQRQWGVEIPPGVAPIPGERVKCSCGKWFQG